MKYGLIGENLSHSFSKEIHCAFGNTDYELLSMKKSDLKDFFTAKDFLGINVTSPYKTEVVKYIDTLDFSAKAIGSVNTVINDNGKLTGYNTDYFGLLKTLERNGIAFAGKKVAILGTGGTSKTAKAVALQLHSCGIFKASRAPKSVGEISYSELYCSSMDYEFIINTTPVGTCPGINSSPIDLRKFVNLKAVIDVNYNPLKTKLMQSAENMGIKAVGGLYMLVAQAAKSEELFFGTAVNNTDEVYKKILSEKQNIVLTGMPGSGKTTIGRLLAEKLNKRFFDTDEIFENKHGSITEYFKKYGESAFRHEESKIIKKLATENSAVISIGGGAVENKNNMRLLKHNGVTVFLNRPVSEIAVSNNRPLAKTKEDLNFLYSKRISLYKSSADFTVNVIGNENETLQNVLKQVQNED